MSFFSKKPSGNSRHQDFSHIPEDMLYFDSACQTQRPTPVIETISEYYKTYNSCGGRVKYSWGVRVDEQIEETKRRILALLNKKESEYAVAFTLNTTTGINQVLSQIPLGIYGEVLTSEIEHNSVFLSTLSLAKRLGVQRRVLKRSESALVYTAETLHSPVAVVNTVSNIDGQSCLNVSQFTKDVHGAGGIILIDAAQGLLQDIQLASIPFDALFFSGHKIYGPSIGVIVIKRTLLSSLDITQLGGGMASEVHESEYTLVSGDLSSSLLELGLQDYAGIIGLNQALLWAKENYDYADIKKLATQFRAWLKEQSHVHVIGDEETSVVTFYTDKTDAHTLAIYCSDQHVMARSGSFCCHYYLNEVKKLPPLIRFSFGAHNTENDVKRVITILGTLFANIS